MVSIITAFGDFFWTSGYNWIRRKDEQTKLEGHSCHEVLVQVFIMSMQLKKLENGQWKNEEAFINECVTLCSLLSKNSPSPGEWSPYKSTTNQFEVFLNTYCQAFDIESGFSWWNVAII